MSQLDAILAKDGKKVDAVLDFQIDDSKIVDRIAGRRIHKPSGRSYHLTFNPPKVPGKDDVTGEPLIQRSDDNPATVGPRLKAFHEQTKPVLDHYAAQGSLRRINADQSIPGVWDEVRRALSE